MILGPFVVIFVSSLDHQEDEIVRFVNLWRRSVAKFKRTLTSASVPAAAFSFQSQTQRLRRLPGLAVANVGVANGGADVLMPERLVNFPEILPHVIKRDRGRAMAQPMGGDLPTPERSTRCPEPQVERAVGKRRARIPANTNCDPAKATPRAPKPRVSPLRAAFRARRLVS